MPQHPRPTSAPTALAHYQAFARLREQVAALKQEIEELRHFIMVLHPSYRPTRGPTQEKLP